MSLENNVAELTIAIRDLIKYMQAPSVEKSAPVEVTKPVQVTKPVEEVKPVEQVDAPITYADVQAAVIAMTKGPGGVPSAVALLGSFGVKKATELTESQWGDFIRESK